MRCLILAALVATACGSTSTGGPPLALAFHKGDVYSYSFQLTANETINLVADVLSETAHMTYTVNSVDAAGMADISLDLTNVVITSTVSGFTAPMSSLPNTTIDLKVAADGRVLSENRNGNPAGGGIIWGVVPGRAVKPGDEWFMEYDSTEVGSSGTIHMTTRSKYLRDDSVQGANAAVVDTTMDQTSNVSEGPAAAGGTTASGAGTSTSIITTWIDRDAHRILKSHLTSKFTETATFDAPPATPTVESITGDETVDLLPG